MLKVYAGYDQREEVGYHVFTSSILERTTIPVSITPLNKRALETELREGTNAFTLSRFLVPYMNNYMGFAVFMDGADMLVNTDLRRIVERVDMSCAAQVVKHDYSTLHPRKYIGTKMEARNSDYERKNWASMMIMNCEHPAWKSISPDYLATAKILDILQLSFLSDKDIGDLPVEWNWLADEYGENENAKVIHWTAGVPGFPYYSNAPHADLWHRQLKRVTHADI